MTTTPTDDLPKLLGSLIREAFTARGFNGKDDDLLDLSALIERTASALADRQARAAQAEPPLTESERAVDAPVTPSDYMAGGANVQHRQREAEAAGQEARESDLRVRVREGDARQRGSQQPSEGVPAAQVERPADVPQPAAVVLNPATGDVRFEPEQQSTAQPVAEAYQRGIVQGMNDVLHNGIDWARAKFGGAPLTAPPRTDAPSLTDEQALLRELWECGAVANWLRVSDDLKARVERALRTASKPTGGKE